MSAPISESTTVVEEAAIGGGGAVVDADVSGEKAGSAAMDEPPLRETGCPLTKGGLSA